MSEAVEDQATALEKKLEALNMSDNSNVDLKSPIQEGEKKRRERKPRLSYEEQLARIEDEQKNKKLVANGVIGSVKWFSLRGHYGFIERDDEEKDVFVHQTAITKSRIEKFYFRNLADGEKVQFDVVEGGQGLEAANVTGPDGANVKGFRFNRFVRRRNPTSNRRGSKTDEKETAVGGRDEKTDVTEDGEKKPRKAPHKRNRRRRGEKKDQGEVKSASEADPEPSDLSEMRGRRRRAGPKAAGNTKDDSGISADGHGDSASLGAGPVDAQI